MTSKAQVNIFFLKMTRKYCFIHIYIYYIVHDCYYTFSLAANVQEFSPMFFHFPSARLCASLPKFLRPLGEIRVMVNGGNQTVVCVRRKTRARHTAFSLPGHRRRINDNTAGGVLGCYRSTKHESHQ